VVDLNNWHQHRISQLIVKKLFGTVSGKSICILGFAFKANTNDTRESAAITICRDLLEEGAILNIYDPKVEAKQIEKQLNKKQDKNLKGNKKLLSTAEDGMWSFKEDIYSSIDGTDAVVVLTEWEEYTNIDWEKAASIMRSPAWVFDARSITNKKNILKSGLNLWRVGDGIS
jgi:UDPglucose 6-dehydrogenase